MSVDYNPPSFTYSTIKFQDSTHALLASYQTTKVKEHVVLTLTKKHKYPPQSIAKRNKKIAKRQQYAFFTP